MCTEGNVTADVFIEFLKRLMQGSTRPIFLIVDGHPVHRSAKVRKFVEGLDGKLQLLSVAGLLARSEPRRARLGASEEPQTGSKHHQGARADEEACAALHALAAENSRHRSSIFQASEHRYAAE
jgi:hypothetical protein